MTLDEFLTKNGMSAAEFGRKVDLTRQTIMLYRRGERFPRGEHVHRIVSATNGAVTANDLAAAHTPSVLETARAS